MSPSKEPAEEKVTSGDEGGGNHEEQSGFDDLLRSTTLDTLTDFDFPYEDFGGIEPDAKPAPTASLLGGRSCANSQGWENAAPKALSELNLTPALLSGAWESAIALAASNGSSEDSVSGVGNECVQARKHSVLDPVSGEPNTRCAQDSATIVTVAEGEDIRNRNLRGRKIATTGTKRPLNPDRMERKANREKRRREEVNEQFEKLLQVLEEAETTSGLQPPASEVAQQASACVNGRRVEVLSRTIWVLKKLLREREELLKTPPSTSHSSASTAIHELTPITDLPSEPIFEASQISPETSAPSPTPSPTSATSTTPAPSSGSPTQPVHLAIPMPAHSTMVLPQGFAMPSGMQPMLPGMPQNMSNQPFFIAVPMYMPSQGMNPCGSETSSPRSPGEAPAVQQTAQSTAQQIAKVAQQATPEESKPIPPKALHGAEVPGKEGQQVPGSGGMPQMMTFQVPQFVARALSAEDGAEKVTHAICA